MNDKRVRDKRENRIDIQFLRNTKMKICNYSSLFASRFVKSYAIYPLMVLVAKTLLPLHKVTTTITLWLDRYICI